MRLGELCKLKSEDIYLEQRYIQLHMTKNGDARQVPLSSQAVYFAEQLKFTNINVSSRVASTLFRKARDAARVKDLHFHDTRHEAITRLSKKTGCIGFGQNGWSQGYKKFDDLL